VELLSWISVKDICGDGGSSRRCLTEGKKWETPKEQDQATGAKIFSFKILRVAQWGVEESKVAPGKDMRDAERDFAGKKTS